MHPISKACTRSIPTKSHCQKMSTVGKTLPKIVKSWQNMPKVTNPLQKLPKSLPIRMMDFGEAPGIVLKAGTTI